MAAFTRVFLRERALVVVLGVAVVLRIAILSGTARMPTQIEDEQHYVRLATSLYEGFGFAWDEHTPTSIRPPLYPFFVAAVWRIAGTTSLQAIRWVQIVLALASVVLLYRIGCRWFDRPTALVAAAGLALYPALLFSGSLLLTETLFTTLLLVLILAFARLAERPTPARAVATGIALGLAALARSVLWPFIFVLAPMVWIMAPAGRRSRATVTLAVMVGYAAVVGPWAARNTALQGTFTVVDTMGGLNLMMGNYAGTPEDRMWDAIGMTGEHAWFATMPRAAPDGTPWTEGKKEKWAQGQAIAYIASHPFTTLRRTVLKFADFWGLERDFIAGVQRGYYRVPGWVAMAGAGATVLAYVLTAILGVAGICVARPEWRGHCFLLSLVLFVCGVHTVVFGHSRYHLPLVPILLLYAGSALTAERWRRALQDRRRGALAVALVILFFAIWSRELLVRDFDRIRQLVLAG